MAEFSPEQKQAAELIAQGHRIVAIAERVGVDRRTIHTWLRDPDYKAMVAVNEAEILEEVRRSFLDLNTAAIAAYRGVLECWETMPASAVRVATTVLQNSGVIRARIEETPIDSDVTVKWAELKVNADN